MKFLNKIKDKSDSQLTKIVSDKIAVLERKNKKNNPDFRCIGCDIGFNFEQYVQ